MLQTHNGNESTQPRLFKRKSGVWTGNKGISIIEMLVVIAILGVTLTGLLGLVNFSLGSTNLIKQTTQANAIAQEAMEAVRNFRDQTSWNSDGLGNLTVDIAYHPEKTVGFPQKWTLVSGEETIGIFTRKVVFETVYRDANKDIAASGAEDTNTKKIVATVSWQERGRSHQVELVAYLTYWRQ